MSIAVESGVKNIRQVFLLCFIAHTGVTKWYEYCAQGFCVKELWYTKKKHGDQKFMYYLPAMILEWMCTKLCGSSHDVIYRIGFLYSQYAGTKQWVTPEQERLLAAATFLVQ